MSGGVVSSRALSLRAGMAWASVGNAIYVACQYAMLVVIAKLGSTEAVGHYALALGVTAPVIVLTQMGLRQVQVTDSRGTTAFGDYLRHRVAWTGVAGAVIAIAALAYGGMTGAVVAAVGAAKAFESISDIVHGHLQRAERMDLVAASMAARGVGSVIVLAAVMALTGSLPAAALGTALFWGAMLLFDLRLKRVADARVPASAPIGRTDTRALTRVALPLAVGATLVSVSANLPRYFLDALYGKEAVALFSVAAAPLALASVLLGSLSQAAMPRAARHYQGGEQGAFARIALWLTGANVLFGLACALAFWLVGRPLVTLLFTPDFADAVRPMVIMSLGMALGGIGAFGSLVLAASRRFGLQLANVLVAVGVQLALGWVLISRGGVDGAAWSELTRYAASAAFLLVMGVIVSRGAPGARRRTEVAEAVVEGVAWR